MFAHIVMIRSTLNDAYVFHLCAEVQSPGVDDVTATKRRQEASVTTVTVPSLISVTPRAALTR